MKEYKIFKNLEIYIVLCPNINIYSKIKFYKNNKYKRIVLCVLSKGKIFFIKKQKTNINQIPLVFVKNVLHKMELINMKYGKISNFIK